MATSLISTVPTRIAAHIGRALRARVCDFISDDVAAVLYAIADGRYSSGAINDLSDRVMIALLLNHGLARVELTEKGHAYAALHQPHAAAALKDGPYGLTESQAQAFACAALIGPFLIWNPSQLAEASGANRRTATAALERATAAGLFADGLITAEGRRVMGIDDPT